MVEKNGKLYLPLLSTLSIKGPPSTWYTDIHLVWLHFKNPMKEKITQSKIKVDNGLWTSNASPTVCLFQNKVMFLLKITLINDKPLSSGLSPLSSHLQVHVLQRWLLNANSTALMLTFLPNIQKMSPYQPFCSRKPVYVEAWNLISHFRVARSLCFKARLSVKHWHENYLFIFSRK